MVVMVTDSSDSHTTWHGPVFKQVKIMLAQFRERSSGPSGKKIILENTHLLNAFLSVSGYFQEYSVRTLSWCQCSQSLEMAIPEAGPRVPHTAVHCLFSLLGSSWILLSAALLTCFLASTGVQRCWENGPWGNFRDISSWRDLAATPGAPQNCSQPRSCCSCFWAALGAADWLVLDFTRKGTTGNVSAVCERLHQAR